MDLGSRAKFPLGQVVATPDALAMLKGVGVPITPYIARHEAGDWGDICEEDRKTNDAALIYGDRVLSAYNVPGAPDKLWILTESDRSVTTVLLPKNW